MVQSAGAECRRLPHPRFARQGLARESRRFDARQRPRVLRQRQGDVGSGHHEGYEEPQRRRDPPRRQRQPDRPPPRARLRPRPRRPGALRLAPHARRDRRPRPQTDRPRRRRERLPRYKTIGAGGDYFTVRGIKRAIDGALGPRGAWLLAPYDDKPDSAGLNTDDPADIRKTAELAIQHGYQLCVHAIGDRANRETLDIFEQTFKAHPDKKDLRWRIEHAQHINAADIPRFGRLGVIASMQGIHCTSDAPYVILRLGPQRAEEGAYVWQKLMKSGAVVSNGTDAPVEDVSPLASFYATVSRKLKDGTVFYPSQRMSREEALKSYTVSNAYAAFEEGIKGALEVGKLADVVVLSRDIMTIPEDDILSTDIVYTIVGGKVRYDKTTGLKR
jgi:predicted amidohydrolase YtcJ